MKKFREAQCPYCGAKVGIINAWVLKTQGEYKCPKCSGYSNIELDSAIYILAVVALLLSAIFFIIHILFIRLFSWFSLSLVITPFLLFFLLAPFLVRLRKPVIRKRALSGQRRKQTEVSPQAFKINNTEKNNMDRTIVMDYIKKL